MPWKPFLVTRNAMTTQSTEIDSKMDGTLNAMTICKTVWGYGGRDMHLIMHTYYISLQKTFICIN